jgi:small subunit ribosomal protein S8e
MGRQPAATKLGAQQISMVRCRGGNMKPRALRIDNGNFSWGTEVCARKTRILDVVYNASSNELVRTKTLVKNAIVMVDATPFRQYYEQRYGQVLPAKRGDELTEAEVAVSKKIAATKVARRAGHEIPEALLQQFSSNRLLACVSSRPGQVGRADGYILEGDELEFYRRRIAKK